VRFKRIKSIHLIVIIVHGDSIKGVGDFVVHADVHYPKMDH